MHTFSRFIVILFIFLSRHISHVGKRKEYREEYDENSIFQKEKDIRNKTQNTEEEGDEDNQEKNAFYSKDDNFQKNYISHGTKHNNDKNSENDNTKNETKKRTLRILILTTTANVRTK